MSAGAEFICMFICMYVTGVDDDPCYAPRKLGSPPFNIRNYQIRPPMVVFIR